MEYTVMVHKAEEGGYWVEVPVLPGCFSQGETVEEALENVREAIQVHLQTWFQPRLCCSMRPLRLGGSRFRTSELASEAQPAYPALE